MQAYASAQLAPLEPELRRAPVQAAVQPASLASNREATTRSHDLTAARLRRGSSTALMTTALRSWRAGSCLI